MKFFSYLLKLLKKISFVFGYELTIKKKFTFLNIYKTYKEALTASKIIQHTLQRISKRFKLSTLLI